MCGIYGAISSEHAQTIDQTTLQKMGCVLIHRGPDDEGSFLGPNAGLGMRRLSIIDLATGHQPMTNEDQTLWLVFNGEIYNYKALRTELQNKGHRFVSESDSEVIIHAYEEYGECCLSRFNGMFAFAIWDTKRQRLFLARDRLGIKPLYYCCHHDELIFGSELKAVIAHPHVPQVIDELALDQFLSLEYIPSPRTIFKDICKLPAGHHLIFERGQVTLTQYWDVPVQSVPQDETEVIECLHELIGDAVRLRLVSDVPVGAFLSGGIDSSTVVAFMQTMASETIQTFSIGFGDPTYNELPYAQKIALQFGTNHQEEVLAPDIALLAEQLIGHLDEPLADFSIFPTYLVSKLASRSVKVVLSGDGGDEIFGGYDTYQAQQVDQYYRWLPARLRRQTLPALLNSIPPQSAKKGLINKTKRFVEGGALPPSLQHTRWMMFMTEADKAELYRPDYRRHLNGSSVGQVMEHHFAQAAERNPLAQQQYVDIKTYLVDNILTKVDRMSMAASIEARVPLLDHRLVEFALNLPPHLKLNHGQGKVILRKAMEKQLPAEILNKPKQGFSIPLKQWLQHSLRPMMLDLLSTDSLRRGNYFDPPTVNRWVNEHLAGQKNHSHRLWGLMVFELWQRKLADFNRYNYQQN